MRVPIPDKQIAQAWIDSKSNYAAAGRNVGLKRQTVRERVLKLRAEGWDLPLARERGYILKDSSEWARRIGQIRKNKC